MTLGDSKTARNQWQPVLLADLAAAGEAGWFYGNAGRDNATVLDSLPGTPATGIDTLLLGLPARFRFYTELITHIAMNWGVNDMAGFGSLVPATWIAQYGQLISYCHGQFPNAAFYISYPWRVGFDAEAATMKGWINTIIANANAAGITCFGAVDEAITIKATDNGFLETDASTGGAGVHYSVPLGVGLYAAAMETILF